MPPAVASSDWCVCVCVSARRGVSQLDGPHQRLHQRGRQVLQAEGSAGQAGDHHHCERRRTRPVGQGERPLSDLLRVFFFFCSDKGDNLSVSITG